MSTETMNRDQAIEAAKVMQAWADGKTIETRARIGVCEWHVTRRPIWSWHSDDYRIKPEPRVIYINEYGDGMKGDWMIHPDRDSASVGACNGITHTSKWIEVIE